MCEAETNMCLQYIHVTLFISHAGGPAGDLSRLQTEKVKFCCFLCQLLTI